MSSEKKIIVRYCKNGNFGDELSPWLIEKLTNQQVAVYRGGADAGIYAIGSILDYDALRSGGVIWGSGILNERAIKLMPRIFPLNRNFSIFARRWRLSKKVNCDIRAVRGRLTYECLCRQGINTSKVYGDPAILLRRVFHPLIERRYPAGLVLHKAHEGLFDKAEFERNGIKLISIMRSGNKEIEEFISEICLCGKIFSSSLHGLIVAHAYGIPAKWIQVRNYKIHREQSFKFYYYFSGIGLDADDPLIVDKNNIYDIRQVCASQVDIPDVVIDRLLNSFPYEIDM